MNMLANLMSIKACILNIKQTHFNNGWKISYMESKR